MLPDAVLSTIGDNIARALRLPQLTIWLTDADAAVFRLAAAHGYTPTTTAVSDAGAIALLRSAPDGLYATALDRSGQFARVLDSSETTFILPLTHGGALVGALSVAPRGPGEGFSAVDRRLLRDLAAQSAAAVHAIGLTAALRSSLEELRQSRERMVEAQEKERRRIQRDLHDGLGPTLASIRLRLEGCLDLVQETASPVAGELERLYELVGQATADIRRLVYDLRPPVLDQLGLVPALRQHCERFSRESGIEVRFDAALSQAIPAAAEVTILRVVQEGLLNIAKHAGTAEAEVQLRRGNGWLVLNVNDDGAGFSGNGTGSGTGVGSMRERAELLGGALHLDTAPGAGTSIEVRIPVAEEAR